MKKWLFALCLVLMVAGLAFSGEWKFKDAVVVGRPEATDGGEAKVNCLGFKNAYGVAVDPDGNVWFASYYRRAYSVYDAAGKATTVYRDNVVQTRPGKPDTLIGTIPIFVLKTDGTIDSLKFLTLPDGKIDTLKAGPGANGTWGNRGMDTDPRGNIIVAQYDVLYQIDYKTYNVLNKYKLPGQSTRPAVDSSGYVYSLPLAGGTMNILDPDLFMVYNSIPNITVTSRAVSVTPDAKQVFVASLGAGAYRYVSAQGVDGTYAIADTILKKVRNLTAAVNFMQWDPKGLLWLASVEEQASPFMWAVDPNNNFAVVDSTSFKWAKFNLTDTTKPAWPRRGYNQPWLLRAPRDAAFSPDGKTMYIADMYGYTIKAYEYVETGNAVTFKVNMGIQEQLGKFNPTTDKVVVRGSFNGWAGNNNELKLGATAKVYEGTVNIPDTEIGKEHFYKFVIVAAAGDVWEADPNRKLVPQAGGQVIDVDYFDRKSTAAEVKTANVTFQADMAEMLQKGWFNPATDQMRVTGGFNGWGYDAKYALSQDLLDPALFLTTVEITDEVGKSIGWKFRGYPEASFLDSGWEGGNDHKFTFTGNALTLDKLVPNVKPAGKPLKQDVTVVFTVNVKGAKDVYNKKAFPSINGVYLNGDFAPLGSGGWAGWTVSDTLNSLVKMYNDGTHSDKVAGDDIWTCEVPFKKDAAGARYFKFGIYAKAYTDTLNKGTTPMDNEAGFAANHLVIINDSQPVYVAPMEYFGSQWNPAVKVERQTGSEMPKEFVLNQNYPNPFNPTTEVTYSVPMKSKIRLSVYNMMGQKIATLFDGEQAAGSYSATWDARDEFGRVMPSGIYFCRMETESMSKTVKMALMK